MANFTIAAPVETEKVSFLHDRGTRPAAPAVSRGSLARTWAGFGLGLVLSVGLTALLFSLRDSWENHREWLVTVIPMLVIAGVALGHLIARGKMVALAPGLALLALATMFGVFDIIADNDSGASDTARDVLSIMGGICLGAATIALGAALFWVELRDPAKAPTPEL